MAVVSQPPTVQNLGQWMTKPALTPDCPPGLEYLTTLDQVIVEQEAHIIEVLAGWECNNKYKILNNQKQQCYYAAEKTDMCMRQCCGPQRAFTIHITDNMGQEIFRVRREFKCCGGCCCCANMDCAAHEIFVETPDGRPLGHTRQLQSKWKPHFGVFNEKNEQQMEIWGPCCDCQCCCNDADLEFPEYKTFVFVCPKYYLGYLCAYSGSDPCAKAFSAVDGQVVAKISKQWSGIGREMFTDADTFSVTFPVDLDVKVKAVLVATVFLIDFMYFEKDESNNNN